jgi:hypothetical protein
MIRLELFTEKQQVDFLPRSNPVKADAKRNRVTQEQRKIVR